MAGQEKHDTVSELVVLDGLIGELEDGADKTALAESFERLRVLLERSTGWDLRRGAILPAAE